MDSESTDTVGLRAKALFASTKGTGTETKSMEKGSLSSLMDQPIEDHSNMISLTVMVSSNGNMKVIGTKATGKMDVWKAVANSLMLKARRLKEAF